MMHVDIIKVIIKLILLLIELQIACQHQFTKSKIYSYFKMKPANQLLIATVFLIVH